MTRLHAPRILRRAPVTVALAALLAAGCGQKGPLTLPGGGVGPAQPEPPAERDEDERRDDD